MSKIKTLLDLEEEEWGDDYIEQQHTESAFEQTWIKPTGVLDYLIGAAKRREVFFEHMSKAHIKTNQTASRYK